MLFINYKAYLEGSGQNAVKLTKILEEVSREKMIKIIPVVQVIDAELVIESTTLDVWIQHIDPVSYGAHTGWTLPEEAVRVGVRGVFLNHSEHKFEEWEFLAKSVARCKEVDLKTLVFAADIEELKKVLTLKPDYVSYEPPELVGSSETSVSREKPEVIEEAAILAHEAGIPLIVGAGIKSKEDVRVGLKLGAYGFAVASDIVKAEDPRVELIDLLAGYQPSE